MKGEFELQRPGTMHMVPSAEFLLTVAVLKIIQRGQQYISFWINVVKIIQVPFFFKSTIRKLKITKEKKVLRCYIFTVL